jgi:MarR family 2-MHQ and catechol resistance regulon transcriptional repressor
MNRALRTIEDRLVRQVEPHGLSLTEFAVLEVLLHKGPLRIGEIGGRILRASGSMTYVTDKLVRRGLIQRRPCATDRRVVFAELTDEGRALIETVFPEHAALVRDLMEGLTPEEQNAAADLLKRLGLHAGSQPQDAAVS